MAGALKGVRVLELAGEVSEYCGKLLAGMGADVLLVEPPEGSPTRMTGPFYNDERDPNHSLHFWHYNLNKKGITCDLRQPSGTDLFLSLVRSADVVLESSEPGSLPSIGLGYGDLKEANPAIVVTSITPFGQSGPYSGWKGSDLIGLATGGVLNVCGYTDHSIPPVRGDGNQAYNTSGIMGLNGTLVALIHAQATGRGQHVDVSVQDCMSITMENQNTKWWYAGTQTLRQTGRHAHERITMPTTLMAADGKYVNWNFRVADQAHWNAFVRWAAESEYAPEITGEEYMDPSVRDAESGMLIDIVHAFVLSKTSREIYEEGQRYGLLVAPINAPEDLVSDPHFRARGFFQEVSHPELGGSFEYPGAPWQFNRTPWGMTRRAPLLGEHNAVVYEGELGLKPAQLCSLTEAGVI